jgi:uncharacterized protein (DUF2235 family)
MPSQQPTSIKTRHVLFFDGTGNSAKSDTNVRRLHDMTAEGVVGGAQQTRKYWPGVGVAVSRRMFEVMSQVVLGSIFGRHTWGNITKGYHYLARNHKHGDEIYMFGFSRGAFATMGLAGLLEWRGLPKEGVPPEVVERQIKIYRRATENSQTAKVPGKRSLGQLERLPDRERAELHELDKEALECFRHVPIEFIGVFDTVRATGLETGWWLPWRKPKEVDPGVHAKSWGTVALRYTRHLPPNVKRGYQALAVDEHRASFYPRVWVIPENEEKPHGRDVEQRWFIGAHANVGGGYGTDPLSDIPLRWMQDKAKSEFTDEADGEAGPGIVFNRFITPSAKAHLADTLADSFRSRWWTAGGLRRFRRPICAWQLSKTKGSNNEVIDHTVLRRIAECEGYRPENMKAFLDQYTATAYTIPDKSISEAMIHECLKRFESFRREGWLARLRKQPRRIWVRIRTFGGRLRRSFLPM